MATGSIQTSSPPPPPPPPPPPLPPPEYSSPPVTIILTVILLVFFFIGFFSIYFCKCFMQNILYTWHLRHSPTETPVGGAASSSSPGLDPMIIKSFPSFSYSNVKEHRREKYGLECAICLIEFEDSDILRLLTPCCHVFHQECIDLWLESHKTCPVCRRNLDSPPIQSPAKSPLHANNNVNMHDTISTENDQSVEDCFSITIKDDNEDETRVLDKGETVASTNDEEAQNIKVQNFYRSHSTGHSLVINKEEKEGEGEEEKEDKYTLRLPEHVKSNIIKGHNSSRSWTTFGDYKTKLKTGRSNLAENSV